MKQTVSCVKISCQLLDKEKKTVSIPKKRGKLMKYMTNDLYEYTNKTSSSNVDFTLLAQR